MTHETRHTPADQHSQDEWSIPQAETRQSSVEDRSPGGAGAPLPRVIHDFAGEKFAFHFAVITVADEILQRYTRRQVVQATAHPQRITLIIGADDDKIDLVTQILQEWAITAQGNASLISLAATAEFIHRANTIADSQFKMMLNIGQLIKERAPEPARSACDSLFAHIIEIKSRDETRVHFFPA